ncbi:MAG: A24 family peptidase [Pseudomonadota bacterium]
MPLFAPEVAAVLAGVLGLLVGSFLNVVIHRLPAMMRRDWLADSVYNLKPPEPGEPSLWSEVFGAATAVPTALETAAAQAWEKVDALPALNLATPRSRCGACGHGIRWYENIPLLSWVALRGRCSACQAGIGLRYPVVEAVTGGLFAWCAWRYGTTPAAALWAAYAALLVAMFAIDLDTLLLPDGLTYPFLWLGLGGAALGWTGVPLAMAIWGAIAGYLCLWLVCEAYRLATGKVGMGNGDFKLLAGLGAWLGADHLIAIVLLSSLVGAVVGCGLLVARRLASRQTPIPFGPFLAGAGLLCLAIGPQNVRHWLPFAFPLA